MAPKKATVTPEQVPAPHYPTPLGHLLLIVVWLLPYFVTVPAHLNTIVSASVTVFVGCWRSVKEAGPTETMSTQVWIGYMCHVIGIFAHDHQHQHHRKLSGSPLWAVQYS